MKLSYGIGNGPQPKRVSHVILSACGSCGTDFLSSEFSMKVSNDARKLLEPAMIFTA